MRSHRHAMSDRLRTKSGRPPRSPPREKPVRTTPPSRKRGQELATPHACAATIVFAICAFITHSHSTYNSSHATTMCCKRATHNQSATAQWQTQRQRQAARAGSTQAKRTTAAGGALLGSGLGLGLGGHSGGESEVLAQVVDALLGQVGVEVLPARRGSGK